MSVVSSQKRLTMGCVISAGTSERVFRTSSPKPTARSDTYVHACDSGCMRVTSQWAKRYPRNNVVWKKTRHVVQTAADPPSKGSNRLATMVSTRKRRQLPRKIATAHTRVRNVIKGTLRIAEYRLPTKADLQLLGVSGTIVLPLLS